MLRAQTHVFLRCFASVTAASFALRKDRVCCGSDEVCAPVSPRLFERNCMLRADVFSHRSVVAKVLRTTHSFCFLQKENALSVGGERVGVNRFVRVLA